MTSEGSDAGPEQVRRPTILDVATTAGVSKGLVSKVFNGGPGPSAATVERVFAVAEQLGYRPNRSATLLAKRRTGLLGVTVLPSNVFHGELTEQVQQIAEENGYELVLGSMRGYQDERRTIETLVDFRCEGLILIGPALPAAHLVPLIAGIPTVVVGRKIDLPGIDVVRCDDEQGVAEVIDYLAGLGHRRVAHLDGGSGAIADLRRRAYRKAMARQGLQSIVVPGGMTEHDGAQALDQLRADAGITAICAFNDRSAIGLLDILTRRGVAVPSQLSVTGFDDSLQARHALINLTTVDQSAAEQARLAIRAILERLDGQPSHRREIVLPPRLVVRGTTGAPVKPVQR